MKKSGDSILFIFHEPGIHKNQTLQFSSIFMTPGPWKSSKIRRFNFLQFLWPRVHENPQKSENSIFFNFHVFGVIRIEENLIVWFLRIFIYMKIHKNHTLQFSWKLNKIKTSDFLWNLNRLIFVDFHVPPGSWKLRIIKASEISWNFMYPGSFYLSYYPEIMKIEENWIVRFLRIFMYPGSWKLKKIESSDFRGFSCTRGLENWRKLNRLIFENFHVPGVMKIE